MTFFQCFLLAINVCTCPASTAFWHVNRTWASPSRSIWELRTLNHGTKKTKACAKALYWTRCQETWKTDATSLFKQMDWKIFLPKLTIFGCQGVDSEWQRLPLIKNSEKNFRGPLISGFFPVAKFGIYGNLVKCFFSSRNAEIPLGAVTFAQF